jgi:NADPH-dependent 2,4-dienoyl-CoA reductase/sulfur reductase-like enzyme
VTKVAIVGAGPAGIAAAGVLAAHGIAVTVIDEGQQAGGQIYRRARAGLKIDIDALLGTEAANYRSFHSTFDRLRDHIDYRPQTLVWGIGEKRLHTICAGVADTVAFDALILATGATDRVLPIPGWTLPGVFTLGGAQVLLKEHGCLIGRRIVFCGSSPLLYLAAKQYRAWARRSSRCWIRRCSRRKSQRRWISWPRRRPWRVGSGTCRRCAARRADSSRRPAGGFRRRDGRRGRAL